MLNQDSPKIEFQKTLYHSFRALGLDDLPSKLMSILQSELNAISLGELSEMTGYSLSTMSTTLKSMEERHLVKRFKKPKSRKVFVLMDKDLVSLYAELQKKRYEQSLMPALKNINSLMNKYADEECFEAELKLFETFEKQMLFLKEETTKYIDALEKWDVESR